MYQDVGIADQQIQGGSTQLHTNLYLAMKWYVGWGCMYWTVYAIIPTLLSVDN